MPTNNINMHGWNYRLYDNIPRTKSRAKQLQLKLKSEGKCVFLNPRRRKSGIKWFVYWKFKERYKKQVIRSTPIIDDSEYILKRLKKALKLLEGIEKLNPAQKRRYKELKELIKKQEKIIKKEKELIELKKKRTTFKKPKKIKSEKETETELLVKVNRLSKNLKAYKRVNQPDSYIMEKEKQLEKVKMDLGRFQYRRNKRRDEEYKRKNERSYDETIKEHIQELKRKGITTKQDFQRWNFSQKTHIITITDIPRYMKYWDDISMI